MQLQMSDQRLIIGLLSSSSRGLREQQSMPLSACQCGLAQSLETSIHESRWNHKTNYLRRIFFSTSEHFLNLYRALRPPRVADCASRSPPEGNSFVLRLAPA